MRLGDNAIFDVDEYERIHGPIETVIPSCIVQKFIIKRNMSGKKKNKRKRKFSAFVLGTLLTGLSILAGNYISEMYTIALGCGIATLATLY